MEISKTSESQADSDANICLDVCRRNVDIPMVQWVCENMNVMEEHRSLPFFESFCFFPFLFSFLFFSIVICNKHAIAYE